MGKAVALFCLFVLLGCEETRRGVTLDHLDCPDALAAAVLACIEKGNPMSDEEGEDLVRQCESTFKHILCKPVMGVRMKRQYAPYVPCLKVRDPLSVQACIDAGWRPPVKAAP